MQRSKEWIPLNILKRPTTIKRDLRYADCDLLCYLYFGMVDGLHHVVQKMLLSDALGLVFRSLVSIVCENHLSC